METEECCGAQPVDGVVLMGGYDKTTPGLLMGATSVNLPAIYLPAGPMLRGSWYGQGLGSGTDVWKYSAETSGRSECQRLCWKKSKTASPAPGPLHDDGDGVNDDGHHRGDGVELARCLIYSRS